MSETVSSDTIELRLKSLSQLFNSMDPSPFHEKDLDDDAEEYIVGWARELHRDHPIRLVLQVENLSEDHGEAQVVHNAVRNFFEYRSRMTSRELRELLGRGRISLVIGLLFVAACIGLVQLLAPWSDYALVSVVRESLIIGGWVALWRPLEIFLYDWWPLVRMRRLYDRLAKAVVVLIPPKPVGNHSGH